jgi:hypothetical protein
MASKTDIQALLLQLQQIALDNKKRIQTLEETILILSSNFASLQISQKPRSRTRTITPVPEHLKCTKILVSGKNKGSSCSKKATSGSLCTMHNKKPIPIVSHLSDEFVPDYILDQDEK